MATNFINLTSFYQLISGINKILISVAFFIFACNRKGDKTNTNFLYKNDSVNVVSIIGNDTNSQYRYKTTVKLIIDTNQFSLKFNAKHKNYEPNEFEIEEKNVNLSHLKLYKIINDTTYIYILSTSSYPVVDGDIDYFFTKSNHGYKIIFIHDRSWVKNFYFYTNEMDLKVSKFLMDTNYIITPPPKPYNIHNMSNK